MTNAAPPLWPPDIGPTIGDLTLPLRWSAASPTDDLYLHGGKLLLGEVFWVEWPGGVRVWRAVGHGHCSHRSDHATCREAQEALLVAVRGLADG